MQFTLQLATNLTCASELYPVDLDFIWKWLGFTRKESCKDLLINNFVVDHNYSVVGAKKDAATVGRPSDKYYTTVDTFKKLAMLAGTKQGNVVREYFLKCEDVAKALTNKVESITLLNEKDAAKLYLASIEDRERLEALLLLQAPKVLLADDFLTCEDSVDLTTFAKATSGLTGYGPNNLRSKLREMRILLNGRNQLPAQTFIDLGYFKVREVVNFGSISARVMVTAKGQQFLIKRLRAGLAIAA